jgi:hypothetical protein
MVEADKGVAATRRVSVCRWFLLRALHVHVGVGVGAHVVLMEMNAL